ncbi:uncharacterized protein LOC142611910 [Castanea sativa]|uniref:uncharacterized protein LOC142611910 n=1 Tax=Castanea sativa TaxID=21020 RepID=UPI003F64C8BA
MKLSYFQDPPKEFIDIMWEIKDRSTVLIGSCLPLRYGAQVIPSAPDTAKWWPPKPGWYKVNTDGAIFEDLRGCGVGVVIRNDRGEIMGAMSKKLDLPLRVLEVETKAVEEGLWFAANFGLKDIIIECDAQQVVKCLGRQIVPPSSICLIMDGIWGGLKSFNDWEIIHTQRNGNQAAHILARQAKFLDDCNIWVEDTPPSIVDQI